MSEPSDQTPFNREKIEAELRGLKDLLGVAQVVVSSLDLDEVLQNILASAMGVMDMPAGTIALYDVGSARLELHATPGSARHSSPCPAGRSRRGG